MAVEWGRRVWNYPTNHETTSMRTQTKLGRRGQMSFPFQGMRQASTDPQNGRKSRTAVREYVLLQSPQEHGPQKALQ